MKIHDWVAGLLLTACWVHTASANQASTEYVQKAIESLRYELTTHLTAVEAQVNQLPHFTPHLGDRYQGGIIFWLDSTAQHGLVASTQDINESMTVSWRNGEAGDRRTNANAQGLGGGQANTRLIIAQQTIDDQQGQFAALTAENYQVQADGFSACPQDLHAQSVCFSGWYLPSLFELFLLNQFAPLQGMYWSSTEVSETQAWLLDNGQFRAEEKGVSARIRAIHAF